MERKICPDAGLRERGATCQSRSLFKSTPSATRDSSPSPICMSRGTRPLPAFLLRTLPSLHHPCHRLTVNMLIVLLEQDGARDRRENIVIHVFLSSFSCKFLFPSLSRPPPHTIPYSWSVPRSNLFNLLLIFTACPKSQSRIRRTIKCIL